MYRFLILFVLIIFLFYLIKIYNLQENFNTNIHSDKKYVIIHIKGNEKDNSKAYDFYKYFAFEHSFNILKLDIEDTKLYLKNNNNKIILFNDNRKAHNILVPYCSKLNNNKYVFIYNDWVWSNIGFDKEFNNTNIKLINAVSKNDIENFCNIKIYKDYINLFNPWCCYDKSFISFNQNPINKILVSGRGVNEEIKYYYDRFKLSKFNHKQIDLKKFSNDYSESMKQERLTNKYSVYLNKYICCFAGSTYRYNHTEKKILNTHCILLKNYEIIGSGSLLLNPLTEKLYLEKIGLIEDVNCMFIDMSDDKKIQDKIDFILDPKNRKFIDKVRKAGQEHGKNNLNSKKKFKELKNIILKL